MTDWDAELASQQQREAQLAREAAESVRKARIMRRKERQEQKQERDRFGLWLRDRFRDKDIPTKVFSDQSQALCANPSQYEGWKVVLFPGSPGRRISQLDGEDHVEKGSPPGYGIITMEGQVLSEETTPLGGQIYTEILDVHIRFRSILLEQVGELPQSWTRCLKTAARLRWIK